MNAKKRKVTEDEQKAVSEILTRIMFCCNYKEVADEWNRIYEDYDLKRDPFTGCPVSNKEYVRLNEEYTKQKMIERFGYYES